ncbi:MAG: hypothetical protein VCB59_05970 [Gammaproteobacteria bacterium]
MSAFPIRDAQKINLCSVIFALGLSIVAAPPAFALDLIPSIFKNTKINRNIWKQQEQHVALAPQTNGKGVKEPLNEHPAILNIADLRDALRSLELWVEGGFFRNEEAIPVLSSGQVATLSRYLVEGLAQAAVNEDVVFVVRGYAKVALDIAKERFWTAGRVFYKDQKLNMIVGTFQLRKDRGVRQAEGAHGVLDNYADLHFDHGSRRKRTSMPGRIVTTPGVAFNGRGGERPDWVQIDVALAADAYRESLVPDEDRKRDQRVKQEAAKLTVERRQMREEMARLRKELEVVKSGGNQVQGLEQRLATLQELKEKDLISEAEFLSRRKAILEEI